MLILTVVATKGGVGKTTLAANFGGLLRDLGYRVLMVDADVQPSLSGYYQLGHKAEHGLTKMVMTGEVTDDCTSVVQLPPEGLLKAPVNSTDTGLLHVVRSDTRDGRLQDWLSNRLDRVYRLRVPLKSPSLAERYDIVLIDTQGAVGHLQDAAVTVADLLITPASPDVISAREFVKGTQDLIERIEGTSTMGLKVPSIRAIINRADNTVDSRAMGNLIRERFIEMSGRVSVATTAIKSAVAFRNAATARVPVHWIDPQKSGLLMHQLLWELIPSLDGRLAFSSPDSLTNTGIDSGSCTIVNASAG